MAGFLCTEHKGKTSGKHICFMTLETRIDLFLLNELVSALRANDPDTFKRRLCGGVQDLGKTAVEELLLDWLAPFLTKEEKDRLIAWHLGVSL